MTQTAGAVAWQMAVAAAAIFAVDPAALSIRLRARSGPVRDRWLAYARQLTPQRRWRVLPPGIPDERLLGGLDLAATLKSGRPVVHRGLLAEVDGGVLLMSMTERAAPALVARVSSAADLGAVVVERDGLQARLPANFGMVALDEGAEPDERPPSVLTDRLALWLDLTAVGLGDTRMTPPYDARAVAQAQERYATIALDSAPITMICETAAAFGIRSLRAPLAAVRAAIAAATLRGVRVVEDVDVRLAAALVLGPRATQLPAQPLPAESAPRTADANDPYDSTQQRQPESADSGTAVSPDERLRDEQELPVKRTPPLEQLIEAARAMLPPHLLDNGHHSGALPRTTTQGRCGAEMRGSGRGRPAGAQAGSLRNAARLDVLATLRAAAPWQRLRRGNLEAATTSKVIVRPEDFRITKLVHRTATTTVFVVDASGSAALNRMAEAKGAVELMLSEAYVRRDHVALIAFAERNAQVLLPPTRSLVRARRCLAALPAGGATPLASGLRAAAMLARGITRKGGSPTLVILSDGRANIALDGEPGRGRAFADALRAAREIAAAGGAALWIDTGKWPDERARNIAAAMHARWLSLPRADARTISKAVRGAA